MLGGVRQCLGHREVDDCPHRLRDQGQVGLLRLDDDAGRQRGPSRQVLQSRCQSALGQHRRSDAAHRFTQVLQGGLRAVLRGIDPLQQRGPGRGGGVLLGQRLSGQAQTAQVHGEGDELLLGAVMQVSLDASAFGLEGVHEGGSAGREVADLGGQLLEALRLAFTRQRLDQQQP